MLDELKSRDVTIQLGTASIVTDAIKGRVLEIGETWLKLQTKKNIEYLQLSSVARIIVNN